MGVGWVEERGDGGWAGQGSAGQEESTVRAWPGWLIDRVRDGLKVAAAVWVGLVGESEGGSGSWVATYIHTDIQTDRLVGWLVGCFNSTRRFVTLPVSPHMSPPASHSCQQPHAAAAAAAAAATIARLCHLPWCRRDQSTLVSAPSSPHCRSTSLHAALNTHDPTSSLSLHLIRSRLVCGVMPGRETPSRV